MYSGKLCSAFRERGIPVALGGTYATLQHDRCAGLADHHFIGEAEHTWPRFLRDWIAGAAETVYEQGSFIDLEDSPAPDWSLIEPKDYLSISVQTSRGCPNRCDFCDAIQYMGRKYRVKPVSQVLEEIKAAHALGAPDRNRVRGCTAHADIANHFSIAHVVPVPRLRIVVLKHAPVGRGRSVGKPGSRVVREVSR